MATLLKDIEVGSLVKLNESGFPAEYMVVNHGVPSNSALYDESCDGTWLLRKDVYDCYAWHKHNSNDYENSDIHSYLNGDFLGLLDTKVQESIKQIKIPYRKGNGYATTVTSGGDGLETKVFLLSARELGITVNPEDGASLSYFTDVVSGDSRLLAYLNGAVQNWWTRSPHCNTTSDYRVQCMNTSGTFGGSSYATSAFGIRPAFVFDAETALVLDDGTVVFDLPTISGEDADLGEKSSVVTVDYAVTTLTGNTATVTERVDDTIIRTYTATSGDTQTVSTTMFRYAEGVHTINITAEADGVTAERNYTFTVPALTVHEGGTVQEFQDHEGNPVFPATLAKAVMTASGESVERTMMNMVSDMKELVKSGAKVQEISYEGTGTYGVNNPTVLTFDFAPKVLMLHPMEDLLASSGTVYGTTVFAGSISVESISFMEYRRINFCITSSNSLELFFKKSEDGKTIYMYGSDAFKQANQASTGHIYKYRWVGIG